MLGIFLFFPTVFSFFQNPNPQILLSGLGFPRKEVIGFLPYWQLETAKTDYSKYITTLAYFGFSINGDGTIDKFANPQQLEPGWNAFVSGKLTPFLTAAKKEHLTLSLVLSTGNNAVINTLIQNPKQHAKNVVKDIEPIMQQNEFSDVNLDIEYTAQASSTARKNFTTFITAVKKDLPQNQTLTVEVMSTDAVKPNLIDIQAVGKIADHIVVMAYDYHSPTSFVTGPVAPLSGAGKDSEYDVTTAIEKTIAVVNAQKVILGLPLYGYAWESLTPFARSAVIAGSGDIASNHRAEAFLQSCATCSAQLDREAQELHISYFDTDTNTYQQFFVPTSTATQAKVQLATKENLGGLALWALGYEGTTILHPLTKYIQ